MDKLASAANSFQLRLAGILMDTWIFFLFVAIAGITPGYLKTLLNGLGPVQTVPVRTLLQQWQGIVLPELSLFQILLVGQFTDGWDCDFYKFLAIACGFLGKNLFETMIYVCELLTDEPEGGSAMIPLQTFLHLYGFLAALDCSGECVCEFAAKLFSVCGPVTVSDESSTVDSSLYRGISATAAEEEEGTGHDVCGASSSESRSYDDVLQVLKECGTDGRHSEIDEVHQQQQEQEQQRDPRPPEDVEIKTPTHKVISEVIIVAEGQQSDTGDLSGKMHGLHEQDSRVGPLDEPDNEPSLYADDDDDDMNDDFSMDYGRGEGEAEITSEETFDDYEPIGLESILQGICECLEPVCEPERVPTPPPIDPFEEFLKRMKNEVEGYNLQSLFRVPGIGPPVAENRVTAVGLWLTECSLRQEGMVGPRNIRHFLCPDLDDRRDELVDP